VRKSWGLPIGLFLLWLSPSCQNPLVPSVPLDDLLAAPLVIELNGRSFSLETYLFRDFMPTVDPGGSPLIAVVYLTADDGQAFPDDVDCSRIWVVNGERVWETTFKDETRPRSLNHINQLAEVARDGPQWEIGARVEVVVRATSSIGGTRLLRATAQVINAVY
jgi:hypothetical protein